MTQVNPIFPTAFRTFEKYKGCIITNTLESRYSKAKDQATNKLFKTYTQ
ncbi:transposase IS1167 [Streptococcus agalactiae LMG 14747]|uniref:Transposase IS1167 n=1 Tax=Streptococcus agalactiae LMG 14747 TaxID=1154860 RepID=V6Z3X7_STRAG|nr:transposase IS1167 [Streptococcus agalactiae LMG 14747]